MLYGRCTLGRTVREQHSIGEARSSLPDLVKKAEAGTAIELTRRGEPMAVLIGRKEYDRLLNGSSRFSHAWDEFVRHEGLASLEIDPGEVFADVRDKASGRDTTL
jgi:prevent-host-death family protein